MSKFSELNQNLMTILSKLISSQNLCKLIKYNSSNPLSEADIDDTSELLFSSIYPYPFTPEVSDTADTVINVVFDGFELGKDNIYFKNSQLTFVVICNNKVWRIDGMLRPFAILNEIDQLFNFQRDIGIGKMLFDNGQLLWVNSQYSGYKVTYNICDFN